MDMERIYTYIFNVGILLLLAAPLLAWSFKIPSKLLTAEQAFPLEAKFMEYARPPMLRLVFDTAPDYYLYKDKIIVEAIHEDGYRLGKVILPVGTSMHDDFFGNTKVYFGYWFLDIPIITNAYFKKDATILVNIQGCSKDPAVCYPAEKRLLAIQR